MDNKNYAKLKRALFEAQRREAIMREQIERCYRQYTPPQVQELAHDYVRAERDSSFKLDHAYTTGSN
jgi:hypothetical protein